MAKSESGQKSVSSKYVTLKVYGKRRIMAFMMAIGVSVFFGVLFKHSIFTDVASSNHGVVAIAVIIAGIILSALPLSEEWQYTPWQDACQKCEKDSFD